MNIIYDYVYSVFIFLMYCIILLYYNIICVIIILFARCSVIVGRHDILPCAAPFKSLQGIAVPFSFFLVSNGIVNF